MAINLTNEACQMKTNSTPNLHNKGSNGIVEMRTRQYKETQTYMYLVLSKFRDEISRKIIFSMLMSL